MGVPLLCKIANTGRGKAFAADCLFEPRLVARDPDDIVVHCDAIDDRTQIGLAERNLARGDIFAHRAAEPFDDFRRYCGRGNIRRPDAVQRRLRSFTFELEGADALLQQIVHIGNTVLDHFVEPLQLVFGVGSFALQCGDTPADLGGAAGTPLGQRGAHFAQPLGGEQVAGEVIDDQHIELLSLVGQ
ncbi:hypothetical protein [Mesorhizobium sp. KR1-2]|uniref:hypothetical protein n=1 Tax=Mesorhizobium sp. KR1-2 TaxID=3156609 RepID=UPI0032B4A07D